MSAEPIETTAVDVVSGAANRPEIVPGIVSDNRALPDTIGWDGIVSRFDPKLVKDTAESIDASLAVNTRTAYESDWATFAGFCEDHDVCPLPADPRVVAFYLQRMKNAGYALATIKRHLSSISVRHRAAEHDSPRGALVVAKTMEGIARLITEAKSGKAPARKADIVAMLAVLDPSRLIGARDYALLTIGFAGAFRRSELVALNMADLTDRGDWLRVHVRQSKTDKRGKGETVELPWATKGPEVCPIRAWRHWITLSGITEGPAFRAVSKGGALSDRRLSDRTVARVVKRTAEAAGYNPDIFAGHSLRSGFITSAAEAHVLERKIMEQSRHKSATVMRGYIKDVEKTVDNAAAAIL